jgi:hypothetical protein
MTQARLTGAAALVLLALLAPLALADEVEDARKIILNLAALIEKGDKAGAAKLAAATKAKDETALESIMHGFKLESKKGIGIGKAGLGIEWKVNKLAERAPAKMVLAKETDDLRKLAYVNLAIAELTAHYGPKDAKKLAKWKGYNDSSKKSTLEFLDALKQGDPAKVKKAAEGINAACNGCHSDFK